jgi:hypothetical protein
MVDKLVNTGNGMLNARRGIGIALAFVLNSQLYPFMLSSAFTARTIVHEKDDVDGVMTDLTWAFVLSVAADLIIAYFLGGDWIVAIAGGGFALALYLVYTVRGNLPFSIFELHHLV